MSRFRLIVLRILAVVIGFVLGVALVAIVAHAKPPPGPIDPETAAWFKQLRRDDGLFCCDFFVDCRVAEPGEIRDTDDGYEIHLNGVWQKIPDAMLVHHMPFYQGKQQSPIPATIICRTRPSPEDIASGVPFVSHLYCALPYSGG